MLLKFIQQIYLLAQLKNLGIKAALIIECSADGSTWTTATGTTYSGQVWSFTLISARYWRVYLLGQTWNYYILDTATTIDSVMVGATFFLGKTVLGLHFLTPPASGSAVQINFNIDIPYKTSNNKLTFNYGFQIGRG